jgi:hypothetical protein
MSSLPTASPSTGSRAGASFSGGLGRRRGLGDEVIPVAPAGGVLGEIERQAVQVHAVHVDASAEQRQECHVHAGGVDAGERVLAESRRIGELEPAGLDAEAREERPADFFLDPQIATGLVLHQADDVVLVLVWVKDQ